MGCKINKEFVDYARALIAQGREAKEALGGTLKQRVQEAFEQFKHNTDVNHQLLPHEVEKVEIHLLLVDL